MSEISTDVNSPEIPPEPPQPIRKKVSIDSHTPRVVWVFMGFTILVFLAQIITENLIGIDIPLVYGIKHNELILNGQWWRLITPMFLHADIVHLGMNMYFLYRLGPILEKFYGPYRFIIFYFVTAFTGVALGFAFSPNPSLGASTAMFGIYGATMVMYHQNAKIFGVERKALMQSFYNFLFINILFGTMVNASHWGHAGGLLGGLLIAWVGGPIFDFRETETQVQFYDSKNPRHFDYAVLLTLLIFSAVVAIKFFSVSL